MEKLSAIKSRGRATTFMIVIFFIRKPNGDMYTPDEIANRKNRKQFDSYDFTYTFGKELVRNEQVGLNKLRKMTVTHLGNYYGGYVIATKADKQIFTFSRNGDINMKADPQFYHDKVKNEVVLQSINIREIQVKATVQLPVYSNVNANKYNAALASR